ncbi:MAG: T9SS type A sorting domain-containing protein [Bacteroidota bacterium]
MKKQYYFILPALFFLLTGSSEQLFATKWQVDVSNFTFTPASLPNVRVGDTVHFQWISGTHTTTSTTIPAGAASWNHPITSASQTFDYMPTTIGVYNYKCTPHAAMGMVGSFTVDVAAGITEHKSSVAIELYPNPVQSNATIKLTSGQAFITGVKIYDVTGKLVIEKDLGELTQNQQIPIDLENLTTGIYFALFTDSENGLTTKRIIKD